MDAIAARWSVLYRFGMHRMADGHKATDFS
jgi:hypothetical protein